MWRRPVTSVRPRAARPATTSAAPPRRSAASTGAVSYTHLYHGKAGFLTFSHLKSVMKAQTALDLPLRYPPYCGKLPFARLLLR